MNFLSPDNCSCANVDPESALIMLILSPRSSTQMEKRSNVRLIDGQKIRCDTERYLRVIVTLCFKALR